MAFAPALALERGGRGVPPAGASPESTDDTSPPVTVSRFTGPRILSCDPLEVISGYTVAASRSVREEHIRLTDGGKMWNTHFGSDGCCGSGAALPHDCVVTADRQVARAN